MTTTTPPSARPTRRASHHREIAPIGFAAAVLALATCWLPELRVVTAISGLVAIVLGGWAWWASKRRLGSHRDLAIGAAVLAPIALVASSFSQSLATHGVGTAEAADGAAVSRADRTSATTALAPGESATVGDYTVTIDEIDLDADDTIADTNSVNEAASGRYVLATATVVYEGAASGDPTVDLSSRLIGADARSYAPTTNAVEIPGDLADAGPLGPGESASGTIAFDVPPDALDAPTLAVTNADAADADAPAFWSVD